MTIIEAVKKAEAGYEITNRVLEMIGKFYKYKGHGYFDLYINTASGPLYLQTVTSFEYGDILTTSWKTIKIDWQNKKPLHHG